MLTVLNEEEDFTSEILRIHSLIEKSAWEWFDCLWRGKRYSYGRLNKNPFADEENKVLKKNERRELEKFWQEFMNNPQKLMKDAVGTQIPRHLYHPNVEPVRETNDWMTRHMGRILVNRENMEKVKGSITIIHNWAEEMKRMNWDGKPNHNFLALERDTWITSAEIDDDPKKDLSKALRELKMESGESHMEKER